MDITERALEQMMQIVAETAAHKAVHRLNLDNGTERTLNQAMQKYVSSTEGDTKMASAFRKQVTLSNGSVIHLSGKSLEDALIRFLESAHPRRPQAPLFQDYATTWIELYHNPNSSARWRDESRCMMDKHILPFFWKMHLDEITTKDIQQFYNCKSNYSREYLKHMKYLINGILQSALEDKLITENPMDSKRLTMSKKATERQALTEEAAKDIIAHIPSLENPQHQLLIALLIYTGLRRGELLALQWKDIDIPNKIIHIHTFLSAASQKLAPKDLQRVAGHSKFDITMNRYAHANYNDMDNISNHMANLYA